MTRTARLASPWPLCLALMSGCTRTTPSAAEAPRRIVISLVGTNDIHGQLGHLPLLGGYVDNLRAERERDGGVILVDAGDAFQGTLESQIDEGATLINAFNVMRYDAMALGNHEFDFGPVGPRSVPAPRDDPFGAIKARIEQAQFPVLCANLVDASGKAPAWKNLHPTTVVEIGGVRVGIVGLLSEGAAEVIKRPNFVGLRTTDAAAALERHARSLRAAGAHAVIAVAHAGGHCEAIDDPHNLTSCDPRAEIFRIAETVTPGLVDGIVAGHRSKAVAHFVSGIPVVQSTSGLPTFSRIDLTFDGGTKKLVDRQIHRPQRLCREDRTDHCEPLPYSGRPVSRSASVEKVVEPGLRRALSARSTKLGIHLAHTMGAFKRAECPMGNLFVDLMRGSKPTADGAFANGGSLRADLPDGELTLGQMYSAMPFDNQIAIVRLTGAELKRIISVNVSQNEHGILSISGFRATIRCEAGTAVVDLVRDDGTPVADDDALTLVTSDFMALGGDGLLASAGIDRGAVQVDPAQKVYDVLVDGLRARDGWDPSDRAIFDPTAPRIRLPEGVFPVACPR